MSDRSYHCWYKERTGTYHVPEQIQGAKHLSESYSRCWQITAKREIISTREPRKGR
ncbi:hypothetical protein M378DRAFT_168925 [Amanita muscaria Koide BX008]|uniref:Uncharacterized protein n=1 Tax=Amanita muscaria (strain Koide BX008) TaxID=946122 RepID=A0A0C2SZT5_AMAMK|nr:hypothetical protein M378DRAFT_168925 [Amanita muscaria Koide BX008]